jgi:hypothetical protein
LRQCQSLVWLDNRGAGGAEAEPIFQSEVVARTDSSLRKLEEKTETLTQMKGILADKLELKQQRRRCKSGLRKHPEEHTDSGKELPFPLGRNVLASWGGGGAGINWSCVASMFPGNGR